MHSGESLACARYRESVWRTRFTSPLVQQRCWIEFEGVFSKLKPFGLGNELMAEQDHMTAWENGGVNLPCNWTPMSWTPEAESLVVVRLVPPLMATDGENRDNDQRRTDHHLVYLDPRTAAAMERAINPTSTHNNRGGQARSTDTPGPPSSILAKSSLTNHQKPTSGIPSRANPVTAYHTRSGFCVPSDRSSSLTDLFSSAILCVPRSPGGQYTHFVNYSTGPGGITITAGSG